MGYKHLKLSTIILALIVAAGIFLYQRPLPSATPVVQLPSVTKESGITLPWPGYRQSALGAVGYGVLAENGSQKSVPMASITKVVTALAVLKQKPLNINQQGPIIALTQGDVTIYDNYYSQDGSVVKVAAGEQISEYQALQAMLLSSANNMADSLAVWAFGSLENYVTYANDILGQLGLSQIHVANTNGFLPQSTASARDLVLLGETALSNPVLAQIVNQKQASVPVAGTIFTTNSLLGRNGVIGIKTGFTDEAGGCYLVADSQVIEGQKITIVGTILGAVDLNSAMNSMMAVVSASSGGFQKITVIHAGQEIGYYKTAWGSTTPVVASQDLSLLTWKGTAVSLRTSLNPVKTSAQKDQRVGTISATASEKTQEIPAVLKQTLPGPSWHWRLFHGYHF